MSRRMPIPEFPGYLICECSQVYSEKKGKPRPLRPDVDDRGRRRYTLAASTGTYVKRFAHCLVMLAFQGPPPEGHEVCHQDGNERNSHLSNLRYDTHSANCADKVGHGTAQVGERNPNAKLSDARRADLIWQYLDGHPIADIAEEFGVTPTTVRRLVRTY